MNAAVPPPDLLTGAQMRKVIGPRKAYVETAGTVTVTRWSIVVEEVDGLLWASDAHNLMPASWLARATVTGETNEEARARILDHLSEHEQEES